MNPERERPVTERLFDTAADLFWHKGYAATTTREIASAVGIQQASLYHHMASKEDLVYKICLSSLERFLAEVPAVVNAASSPLDRIQALIRAHLATLLRHQRRYVTVLTELRSLTPPHFKEVVALRDQYDHFVRSIIESAQSAGLIRGDIATKYLSIALMSVLNYTALWFRKEQALGEDQLAGIFTTIFFKGAAKRRSDPSLRWSEPVTDADKLAPRSRKKSSVTRNCESPALARALDAAVALFSRKGYTATSTREVAALIGMQKASLYYHIDSKEDLLYLVCRATLEQIRHDVETAIQGVDEPLDRLRALIVSHVESLVRDAQPHSITFTEMHALSKDRLAQVVALRDEHEGLVRNTVQEGQRAGVLRDDIDAKYLCLTLFGMINRVTRWYRPSGPLAPNQVGQLLAVIFLTGAAV